MPRRVFLDVGNVLLDEDPLSYLCFLRHVEAVQRVRPDLGFFDLLAERTCRVAAGARWPVYEVVSAVLDESACAALWEETDREVRGRYAELSPVLPGAVELVEQLSRRFPLGLIANQGRECRTRLAALGLLDRFDVIAFSEEQGASKPDPALFQRALEHAGAGPSDCVMVGDRLDNDISPAACLGLRTVWVRWPRRASKGWRPRDPRALAYRAALERTQPRGPDVPPTRAVDDLHQLLPALLSL